MRPRPCAGPEPAHGEARATVTGDFASSPGAGEAEGQPVPVVSPQCPRGVPAVSPRRPGANAKVRRCLPAQP